MDTHQLRSFIEVSKCENMSMAAEKLGISQPSLSQSIKKLEQSLGLDLFDRKGRSIRLNENGELLYPYTDIAFRAMENAVNEIHDLSDTNFHTVRLIARQPMGNHAATLQGFYRKHPNIALSYIVPNEQTRVSDYDVEFFASGKPQPKGNNIIKLCTEDYVVLVGESHRLARKDQVSLSSLRKERFILSPAKSEMSGTVQEMLESCGYQPTVAAYVSNYWDTMKLVEEGAGICIAGNISWLLNSNLKVRVLRLDDIHRTRSLYLRWPANAYLSRATRSLINYLTEAFKGAPELR